MSFPGQPDTRYKVNGETGSTKPHHHEKLANPNKLRGSFGFFAIASAHEDKDLGLEGPNK